MSQHGHDGGEIIKALKGAEPSGQTMQLRGSLEENEQRRIYKVISTLWLF